MEIDGRRACTKCGAWNPLWLYFCLACQDFVGESAPPAPPIPATPLPYPLPFPHVEPAVALAATMVATVAAGEQVRSAPQTRRLVGQLRALASALLAASRRLLRRVLAPPYGAD